MRAFLWFLRHRKRYWIPPVILYVVLLAILAWQVAGIPLSPFIYELF